MGRPLSKPAAVQAYDGPQAHHGQRSPIGIAMLGALGVVYGDIGTSPLYALKEAVRAASMHGTPDPRAIVGCVSMILWALILVISVKYALLIMRAGNRGEGGIMAMLALLRARHAKPGTPRAHVLVLGLVGAALLYGDGAITPAIMETPRLPDGLRCGVERGLLPGIELDELSYYIGRETIIPRE